jgi:two-component system OmpR family response regulator
MKTLNNNPLIFLVDDDLMFLKSMKQYIHRFFQNSSIITFSSGEECLNNLFMKPDIILLDYMLDGVHPNAMNGVKILDKVKETEPETSVILFSAQDHIDVAVNTMKHGAFDYIVKNDHIFVRVQNAIKNVLYLFSLKEDMQSYKLKMKVFTIVLTIILAFVVYLQVHWRIFM